MKDGDLNSMVMLNSPLVVTNSLLIGSHGHRNEVSFANQTHGINEFQGVPSGYVKIANWKMTIYSGYTQ